MQTAGRFFMQRDRDYVFQMALGLQDTLHTPGVVSQSSE
jgi:hypothetical protein